MIKNNIKKTFFVFMGVLAVVLILIGPIIWENEFDKNLKVIFLDVGQGDSILIKTPYKQNILIDGGPDDAVLYGLGKNIPFYKQSIDLMILTHFDLDHITGLISVLERYKVKSVFYNGLEDDSPEFQEWLRIIKEKDILLKSVKAGDNIIFGNDLALKTFYPLELLDKKVENNNTSVVNKLVYKTVSFLFTGDLEKEGEKDLLTKKIDLESDVLKISHHGAKKSTSKEFLDAINPKYAIISVGKNNFGHPSLRVLKRLERSGVKILRTDLNREIKMVTDGRELKIIKN